MALTDDERVAIQIAGRSASQAIRSRACSIVRSKTGTDAAEATALLARSYLEATAPSFYLIPRGEAMLSEQAFADAYAVLERHAGAFTNVTVETLTAAMLEHPAALAPLRMVAGLTYNELAVAVRTTSGATVTGNALRSMERGTAASAARRRAALEAAAEAIIAFVGRRILRVPQELDHLFHSKVDKRDTAGGWSTVAESAVDGVPYWAYLYQRYVGGVWRQVQDAYSEIKGDALLELPIAKLLSEAGVPFYRSPTGATGARATAQLYGVSPGPDFLIPGENPNVIIESKVGEDGGTVRDKAARILTLAEAASRRGLVLCAVIDGRGWSERASALADVVLATQGRTFSLSTIPLLLDVPEIAVWRGQATP